MMNFEQTVYRRAECVKRVEKSAAKNEEEKLHFISHGVSFFFPPPPPFASSKPNKITALRKFPGNLSTFHKYATFSLVENPQK